MKSSFSKFHCTVLHLSGTGAGRCTDSAPRNSARTSHASEVWRARRIAGVAGHNQIMCAHVLVPIILVLGPRRLVAKVWATVAAVVTVAALAPKP